MSYKPLTDEELRPIDEAVVRLHFAPEFIQGLVEQARRGNRLAEAGVKLPDECPYWGLGPCEPDCWSCVARRAFFEALAAYRGQP